MSVRNVFFTVLLVVSASLTASRSSVSANPADIPRCGLETEVKGGTPPDALEMWCQMRGTDAENGKDGPYRRWHENGRLAASGNYVRGAKEGTWRMWQESGVI